MGTMIVNADPHGYRDDGPTSFYVGFPLEYHSFGSYNGSLPLPGDAWVGLVYGGLFTLSGSTGTQFGPANAEGTFAYTMSVNVMTIYQVASTPDGLDASRVMATATIPTFTHAGVGSLYVGDGDGVRDDFDL